MFVFSPLLIVTFHLWIFSPHVLTQPLWMSASSLWFVISPSDHFLTSWFEFCSHNLSNQSLISLMSGWSTGRRKRKSTLICLSETIILSLDWFTLNVKRSQHLILRGTFTRSVPDSHFCLSACSAWWKSTSISPVLFLQRFLSFFIFFMSWTEILWTDFILDFANQSMR